MASKTKKPTPCAICGETKDTPVDRLTHILIAHGPLAKGASKGRRRKAVTT